MEFDSNIHCHDITKLFLSKIHGRLTVQKKEPPNQFLINSTIVKERIEMANQRLIQFTAVAQQTGLFNDQDYKLNSILGLVKEDIDWIHSQLEELKQQVNNELNQSIMDLIQQSTIKLSDRFKKTLQEHTLKIKTQEEKRHKLGERDRLIRRGGYGQKKQNTERVAESPEHQMIEMYTDQKVNQSKLNSMRRIEEMLNDVATVFQRVGTMVRLQETMIDRIDKYTDDSLVNVNKGRKQLQDAHKRASENRGLILKIFMILFIFSFVYIVFVL